MLNLKLWVVYIENVLSHLLSKYFVFFVTLGHVKKATVLFI